MEHTPDTCPNHKLIKELQEELEGVKTMFHNLDKDFTSNSLLIKSQYETIITMLSNQGSDYKELYKLVNDLEKKFVLNDYKTNKTTDVLDRVTWGVVAKIGTLLLIVGSLIIGLLKG